jgi:hypothetical protein
MQNHRDRFGGESEGECLYSTSGGRFQASVQRYYVCCPPGGKIGGGRFDPAFLTGQEKLPTAPARRKHFASMVMVIWSILTQPAWKELRQKHCLRASRCHTEKSFLASYDWMSIQMERRLKVSRPSKITMPMWVWHQWEGRAKPRPDLRASGHLPKGTRGILVEFEVQDDRLLLSDFESAAITTTHCLTTACVEKSSRAGNAFLTYHGLILVIELPRP